MEIGTLIIERKDDQMALMGTEGNGPGRNTGPLLGIVSQS